MDTKYLLKSFVEALITVALLAVLVFGIVMLWHHLAIGLSILAALLVGLFTMIYYSYK